MLIQVTNPVERARKVFYFALAGGTGFLIYLCVSNFMHYVMHVSEVTSAITATLLPIPPTFWMQRRLTFRNYVPKRRSFPRYALLQLCNAALIGGLTEAGVRLAWPAAMSFIVAGATGVIISYFVQAKVVFPGR